MSKLAMWVVYDSPSDYPGKFVARRWEVGAEGPRPTESMIIMEDLEALRDVLMVEMGLVKLMRSDGDDPKIVETWM